MIVPLPMRVERCDSVPVATLAGEVEISRVGNLRDRLLRLLDNRDFGLVVDLSRVTYVDSVGVNVLFDVADSLSGRQMRLATRGAEGRTGQSSGLDGRAEHGRRRP